MEAIKSDRTERSMEVSCNTVWNDCLEVIREDVGEENFNTWFKPIAPIRVDGDVLTIVTDYPPGFGTSRHTWRIEGGNLWTTYRSSDFAEDEGWFAMLDPVPWAPMS